MQSLPAGLAAVVVTMVDVLTARSIVQVIVIIHVQQPVEMDVMSIVGVRAMVRVPDSAPGRAKILAQVATIILIEGGKKFQTI